VELDEATHTGKDAVGKDGVGGVGAPEGLEVVASEPLARPHVDGGNSGTLSCTELGVLEAKLPANERRRGVGGEAQGRTDVGDDLLAQTGIVGVKEGAAVEGGAIDHLVNGEPEGTVHEERLPRPYLTHDPKAHEVPLEPRAVKGGLELAVLAGGAAFGEVMGEEGES
jgi:hypothetical protein